MASLSRALFLVGKIIYRLCTSLNIPASGTATTSLKRSREARGAEKMATPSINHTVMDQALTRVLLSREKSIVEREISLSISKI